MIFHLIMPRNLNLQIQQLSNPLLYSNLQRQLHHKLLGYLLFLNRLPTFQEEQVLVNLLFSHNHLQLQQDLQIKIITVSFLVFQIRITPLLKMVAYLETTIPIITQAWLAFSTIHLSKDPICSDSLNQINLISNNNSLHWEYTIWMDKS